VSVIRINRDLAKFGGFTSIDVFVGKDSDMVLTGFQEAKHLDCGSSRCACGHAAEASTICGVTNILKELVGTWVASVGVLHFNLRPTARSGAVEAAPRKIPPRGQRDAKSPDFSIAQIFISSPIARSLDTKEMGAAQAKQSTTHCPSWPKKC
jgi:hypothetical protein